MSTATDLIKALKAIIDRRSSLILDDDQTQQIQALARIAREIGINSVADQCDNVIALDHNNRLRRTRAIVRGQDQTASERSIDLTETDQTEIDGERTAIDCRYLLPDRTEIDQTEILCAFENGRGQDPIPSETDDGNEPTSA